MKSIYKKSLMLLVCLLCMTFSVLAQESITFTWGANGFGTIKKSFNVTTTGTQVMVDWTGSGTFVPEPTGSIEHNYSPQASYNVTVKAMGSENFISFACNSMNVSLLNTSGSSLEILDCSFNVGLQLTGNAGLESLDCQHNEWGNLNFNASSYPALTYLDCSYNELTLLDVHLNSSLTYLNCSYNHLDGPTALVLNSALGYLNCDNYDAYSLKDLHVPASVTILHCTNNELKNLDVPAGVIELGCGKNRLSDATLILHNPTLPSTLFCHDNAFTLPFLFDASQAIMDVNKKRLGTQILETIDVALHGIPKPLAPIYMNTMTTDFIVTRATPPILPGDYTTADNTGKRCIAFNMIDLFTVEMSNKAIISSVGYPAKVIALYNVVEGVEVTASYEGCGTMEYDGFLVDSILQQTTFHVLPGDSVGFTFAACSCYEIDSLIVERNGVPVSLYKGVNTYTLYTNNTDTEYDKYTVHVIFKQIPYTITATACASGTITPNGAVIVNCQDDQLFTFTATGCYEVAGLLINGSTIPIAPDSITAGGKIGYYTFKNVLADGSIEVVCTPVPDTITATACTNATITPSGFVVVGCGGDQTFTFASTDACYPITGLLIDGTNVADSIAGGSYTFTNVVANHTIEVVCAQRIDTIYATACTGGTLIPDGSVLVGCGDDQTFAFTAGTCYEVTGLLIDGATTPVAPDSIMSGVGYYTFANVNGTHSIEVVCDIAQYEITLTVEGNGTVAPNGGSPTGGIITVDCGDDQLFTFASDACHKLDSVFIDGVYNGTAVTDKEYTFMNVSADHTIRVVFSPIQYTITVGISPYAPYPEPPVATLAPIGAVKVNCGEDQLFAFWPVNPCYQVDFLLFGDGTHGVPDSTDASGKSFYTFHDVRKDDILIVYFKKIPYIITVTTSSCPLTIMPVPNAVTGEVAVNCGEDKTFVFAISDPCYRMDSVYIDGVRDDAALAAGTYTFVNVQDSTHTIEIFCSIIEYNVTLSANPTVGGTVTGDGTYDCGDLVTIEATPNGCYTFEGWSVGGTIVTTDNPHSFTITRDTAFVAEFEIKRYIITTTACATGTITPSDTINCGTDKIIRFTPGYCYHVSRILVDGTPLTGRLLANAILFGSYTFRNVRADHTIEIECEINVYPVGALAGPNGSINPTPIAWVNCGSDQLFTITPDHCYEIDQVRLDASPVALDSTDSGVGYYTLKNVVMPHIVYATFSRIQHTITVCNADSGYVAPYGVGGVTTVLCGDDITFTVTYPDICDEIDEVLIDGVNDPAAVAEVIATGTYTFYNVDANHTFCVTYKWTDEPAFINAYSGPNEGGKLYPNGWIFTTCGKDTTFKIIPNPGYQINRVYVDGVNDSMAVVTGSYTFYHVKGNHTITADFIFIGGECQGTLFITASTGSTGGSIFPSGSYQIECYGSKPYEIYPQPGYEIDGIYIDGILQPADYIDPNGVGYYAFHNVIVSHTIKVTFKKIDYTITSSANAGGTIAPLGIKTIAYGGSQVYTITSNTGYKIDSVLIDGVNNPTAVGSGKYTFSNVIADHTIRVVFTPRTFTITASTGANGTISPIGAVLVNYGASETFNFVPNAGFKIDKVLVNGKNNSAAVSSGSYTFTNVTGNQTIAVSFASAAMPAPPSPIPPMDGETEMTTAYPNPTTGILNLKNDELKINSIQVFDTNGKLMQEIKNVDSAEISIDLSTYPEGVYFLNVDGQKVKVMKQQ